jgi:hypothetical protein
MLENILVVRSPRRVSSVFPSFNYHKKTQENLRYNLMNRASSRMTLVNDPSTNFVFLLILSSLSRARLMSIRLTKRSSECPRIRHLLVRIYDTEIRNIDKYIYIHTHTHTYIYMYVCMYIMCVYIY